MIVFWESDVPIILDIISFSVYTNVYNSLYTPVMCSVSCEERQIGNIIDDPNIILQTLRAVQNTLHLLQKRSKNGS
ncbi:hypothetical protein YC2023_023465 [Brassica napus]